MPSIFCEQCGSELLVDQQELTKKCQYCGAENRIPKSITRTERMYQMAVRYRMRKNFDAARQYYENILEQDSGELEACWGILLCKYGVEYKNSDLGERVVYCHRICESAVTADIYYKMIATYANAEQLEFYAQEAAKIQKAQQELLNFVKREVRYDVYLCYKEQGLAEGDATDKENIRELVAFLEKDGIRVFYDREKIEQEQPEKVDHYLLAAQYAAPVMIVYGSKKSFFSQESVLKEWSSYRSLMQEKKTKKMFVACSERFMYSLPEELLDLPKFNLDSLDFFEQIKKEVFGGEGKKNTAAGNSEVENIYIRAQYALEDGNFEEANAHYTRVLEKHPEEGRAYWGRLLCECKCMNGEQLRNRNVRIDDMPSYKFAVLYAAQTDREYYEDVADSILQKIRDKERAANEAKLQEQKKIQEEQLAREKMRLEQEIIQQKRNKKGKAVKRSLMGALAVAAVLGAAGGVLWYQQNGQYQKEMKQAFALLEEGNYYVVEDTIAEQYAAGIITEEEKNELFIQYVDEMLAQGDTYYAVEKLMEIRDREEAIVRLDEVQAKADQLMESGDPGNAFYYYDMLKEYRPENINVMREYLLPYRDWLSVSEAHAVIKKANGTAMIYGWDMDTALVQEWTDLTGIYTFRDSVFGWTNAGTVYAAGSYSTDMFAGWGDIIQVAGNSDNVIGLTKSGNVLSLKSGTSEPVAGIENIKRIAAGSDGTFALLNESGEALKYNANLSAVQARYDNVFDIAYSEDGLNVLSEVDIPDTDAGIAGFNAPNELMIYPGRKSWSYLASDGSAEGSFCGAMHQWFTFRGPRSLVTSNGMTGIYSESREMDEEAIYYITITGDVYVRYGIHGYDKLGIISYRDHKEFITNIYE